MAWLDLTAVYPGHGVVVQRHWCDAAIIVCNVLVAAVLVLATRPARCLPRQRAVLVPSVLEVLAACFAVAQASVAATSSQPADCSVSSLVAASFCGAALARAMQAAEGVNVVLFCTCLRVAFAALLCHSAIVALLAGCDRTIMALDLALACAAALETCCSLYGRCVSQPNSASASTAPAAGAARPSTRFVTFSELSPLFDVGSRRQVGMGDLPALPADVGTAEWAARGECLAGSPARGGEGSQDHRIWRLLRRVFGARWCVLGVLQAATVALTFAGPLLLNRALAYLESDSSDSSSDAGGSSPWWGVLWASCMVLATAVSALVSVQFNTRGLAIQTQLRAVLAAAVFRRMLTAPPAQRARTSPGTITNFLSADIQRLMDAVTSTHQLWALPVQVGVTLYLLDTQVRSSFLAGLAVILLFVPVNLAISRRIGALTGVMMAERDERVRRATELLASIRTVKMLAWEAPLLARIQAARRLEVAALASRKYLDAACVFLWASTPVLVSLATFAAVVLSSAPSASGAQGTPAALSASSVFTTVSLLSLLIFPLNAYSWVVTGVLEAQVSLRRLQAFFDREPSGGGRSGDSGTDGQLLTAAGSNQMSTSTAAPRGHAPPFGGTPQPPQPVAACSLRGCFTFFPAASAADLPAAQPPAAKTAASIDDDGGASHEPLLPASACDVSGDSSPAAEFTLQAWSPSMPHAPLTLPSGCLIAVTGPVGAGKSALLSALLGLMQPAGPSTPAAAPSCTFSYAPQVPWVFGGSLRDNVLLGEPFDASRYAAVLAACCLREDIATLAAGDATEVSQTSLSGGQMARIGLARALYSDSEVLLADDPLASLDARVALQVWQHAFSSFQTGTTAAAGALPERGLHLQRRAVVIATHDPRFVRACDHVIILRNGRVAYAGPPAAAPAGMLAAEPEALPSAAALPLDAGAAALSGGGVGTLTGLVQVPTETDASHPADESSLGCADKAVTISGPEDADEQRQAGVVKQRVLRNYGRAVGWGLAVTVLASLTIMQLTRNGSDWWLSLWSAADTDPTFATGVNAPVLRRLNGLGWGDRQYLIVFGAIAAANSVATLVRSWTFAAAGLRACQRIHDALLRAITYAPMAFHDLVPVGRLLNRISADQFSTDETLPFQLNIFLAQTWGLAGTVLVLCFATSGIFVGALPLLAVLYFRLQRRYRATSRELKRLDSVTRSPLFAHFTDCLNGSGVLTAHSLNRAGRVVGQAATHASAIDRACMLCVHWLDANQTTSWASGIASQWLGLRLQAIGTLVTALVAFFAVGTRIFTDAASATATACGASGAISTVPHASAGGGGAQPSDYSGMAGVAGFALSYAIPVVGALQGLIGALTETEKELVAVERAQEYCDVAPEDAAARPAEMSPSAATAASAAESGSSHLGAAALLPGVAGSARVQGSLNFSASGVATVDTLSLTALELRSSALPPPVRGTLSLEGVTVRYPGTLQPALNAVTLSVPQGLRVGIGGRTGSGKSTLLAALLRLTPLESGRICLDGVDTANLPLHTYRSHVCATIPQQPLLVAGSVRLNLDPTGVHSDAELLSVLAKCGLRTATATDRLADATSGGSIRSLEHAAHLRRSLSLDDPVAAGGSNLSVGERQLLALSRTLLRRPQVLLVDEAASAADAQTDDIIGSVLSSSFRGCTALIVAHRPHTLLGCDLVVILRDGSVAEVGIPSELMSAAGGSELRRIVTAGATSVTSHFT